MICPFRLLERNQIFIDCLHLLTQHEPGNELHILKEINIPGGNVDYFLLSVRGSKVIDFVGIELQTVDTTGTVWPERQRFAKEKGLITSDIDLTSKKLFGMNWKMSAKTILVQMHHKTQTFQHLNKHLVLVIQDYFFDYINREFNFSHLNNANLGDVAHFHSYRIDENSNGLKINLSSRYSTDVNGIAKCLGLKGNHNVELESIVKLLESKISDKTMFTF